MGRYKVVTGVLLTLFVISIYQDLTDGTQITVPGKSNKQQDGAVTQADLVSMRVKVESGETVLTIVERINNSNNIPLNIDEIMNDFVTLNPTVDPHHLVAGEFYSFPVY